MGVKNLSYFNFYMDAVVGMNICTVSAGNFLDNKTYVCEIEKYYLEELLNWNWKSMYGNSLINTCNKEKPGWIKVEHPGGPEHDSSKNSVRFEAPT